MQRAFRLVVLFFLGLSVLPCLARSAQDSSPIEKSSEARANASETVAILPFIYENGTPGAHTAAEEFMETTLTKSQYFRADSFRIISQAQVTLAWTKDMGFGECTERTPAKLLRLGEKLGVDWVISGRAYWHTRSVWIGLGPKTKSDCTLDMMIVDVKRAEVALDARQVKQDCAPKDSPLKAATAIVLGLASRGLLSSSLPLTIVSGGPKTPRECSAVQLAIAKAIQPWLAVHPGNKKIDTSDSSENVAQALPDAHRQGADQ